MTVAPDPAAAPPEPAPAERDTVHEADLSGTGPVDPDRSEVDDHRMPFLEHLAELRKRLRNAAIAFLGALVVSLFFVEELFEFLTRPVRAAWHGLHPEREWIVHLASPTEAFWVYMKLALVGALLVAAPFIFRELWKFVAPGLYRRERRMGMLLAAATGVCFSGGALFGYRILCPPALHYLLSFAKHFPGQMPFSIEPTVMMNELFDFLLMMLAGCGVAFELPVALGLLGWLGIISAPGLWRFNRFALVLSAILGGILTPGPDVLSQVLMSVPLFGLYNISIVVVWLMERSRRKREAAEAAG